MRSICKLEGETTIYEGRIDRDLWRRIGIRGEHSDSALETVVVGAFWGAELMGSLWNERFNLALTAQDHEMQEALGIEARMVKEGWREAWNDLHD